MYGKNKNYNLGDNIYYLQNTTPSFSVTERVMNGGIILFENKILIPKNEEEFSYWKTISDNGGIDTIDARTSYDNVTINLNQSKVKDMYKAGIYLSQNNNPLIKGGLMIEKGVIIENIISGIGDDILYENEYDNEIDGNMGQDTVHMLNKKDNYLILRKDINTLELININNNNEKNILHNIEKIYFNISESLDTINIKKTVYPYGSKGYVLTLVKKT